MHLQTNLTHVLNIGAMSKKSRVKMGHKPLWICHLSSRRRQIHAAVDDIPFHFLCEDEERGKPLSLVCLGCEAVAKDGGHCR